MKRLVHVLGLVWLAALFGPGCNCGRFDDQLDVLCEGLCEVADGGVGRDGGTGGGAAGGIVAGGGSMAGGSAMGGGGAMGGGMGGGFKSDSGVGTVDAGAGGGGSQCRFENDRCLVPADCCAGLLCDGLRQCKRATTGAGGGGGNSAGGFGGGGGNGGTAGGPVAGGQAGGNGSTCREDGGCNMHSECCSNRCIGGFCDGTTSCTEPFPACPSAVCCEAGSGVGICC